MTEMKGCTMWRGITAPEAWVAPDAPEAMYVKYLSKQGKEAIKYATACAVAMELSADGLTRDGKVVKEGDLFAEMAQAYVEAKEAKEAARKQAEQAKADAAAKALRMEKLSTDIKLAQEAHARAWQVRRGMTVPPEAGACESITFEQMETWANIARESGAYLVMHGGNDQGSGISVRFTGAAQVKEASAPKAPREAGSGSKGGSETRASAYACALQAQKVGGCPHNITRTGDNDAGYTYLDHGKVIVGPLSKYLRATYPRQGGAGILDGYDARRAAANASK